MTVRSKRLLTLLCTHVKSTLPRDVWMLLNVCTVKMIEINKIKELLLGPYLKKRKKKITVVYDMEGMDKTLATYHTHVFNVWAVEHW